MALKHTRDRHKGHKIVASIGAVLFFLSIINKEVMSSLSPNQAVSELKYRTSFGQCPSRTAGNLTLQLIKEFEQTGSLRKVKSLIVKDRLAEKHFISSYKVSFDPLKKFLQFKFDCPVPLMKVQVYKDNGLDSYEAILVESGELFDPTYEVLLRSEKKLNHELPFLALPVGEMEETVQGRITELVSQLKPKFRRKLSEVIINDSGDLTIILSVRGNPSSVFMGETDWNEKMGKLKKIIRYMEAKKKIPAIINLTNAKKVVVKFNDKF